MYEESETKLMFDGNHLLSVYSHEISVGRNGEIVIEIGDAIERKLWDLSVSRLVSLKEFLKNDSSFNAEDKIQFKVIQTINKVLVQREFMKKNYQLRSVLLPE
ncbi:hypothetical protein ACDZ28_00395 (plasmid) [Paenibacillus sp. RS8]|uniref:hypothetical protein n=1 Tax=Paenibacillus sp. RS8 TaxID=3242681 RepID=UPI0035BF7921